MITIRTQSQDSQKLQQDFNVCQETLKTTRNEVTRLNAAVVQLSSFQGRVDSLTSQNNALQANLNNCQAENKQFATSIQSLQLQIATIPNLQTQIE